jgi:hypothetical protein
MQTTQGSSAQQGLGWLNMRRAKVGSPCGLATVDEQKALKQTSCLSVCANCQISITYVIAGVGCGLDIDVDTCAQQMEGLF